MWQSSLTFLQFNPLCLCTLLALPRPPFLPSAFISPHHVQTLAHTHAHPYTHTERRMSLMSWHRRKEKDTASRGGLGPDLGLEAIRVPGPSLPDSGCGSAKLEVTVVRSGREDGQQDSPRLCECKHSGKINQPCGCDVHCWFPLWENDHFPTVFIHSTTIYWVLSVYSILYSWGKKS